MAGVNQGDIVQVSVQGLCLGQMTLATMEYICTASSTSPSYVTAVQNIADNFRTGPINSWAAAYVAVAPNNWTLVNVRAQVIYPTRGIFRVSAASTPGGYGSGASTTNVTGVITKRTISGKRWGLGRLHLAPLPNGSFGDGVLTGAYTSLLATLVSYIPQTLVMNSETTALMPILFSINTPTRQTPVISADLQNTVRVLRRRTLGVGK